MGSLQVSYNAVGHFHVTLKTYRPSTASKNLFYSHHEHAKKNLANIKTS